MIGQLVSMMCTKRKVDDDSKAHYASAHGETQVALERKNRIKWETYLTKYRTRASKRVSREMQTVMLERFLEETEKCPPEPKCEKFKPCPGKRKSSSKMNHEGKSLKEICT